MKALDVIKKTMQAEVKPTIAQQAKQTSSSENPAIVKPTLNPIVSATPAVTANPIPKPTQTAAPAVSKAGEDASWWDMLNSEPETSPEEQAKIEKRKRAIHNIASIGDAIASVSNLAATTQGAQSAYNPATNLTDAARQRYDAAEALRQKNLAMKQAKWQDKMKAISDRAKILQEQESQRAEEEYRNRQLTNEEARQAEMVRANMVKEGQEDTKLSQSEKYNKANIDKLQADAYESRQRGASYADKNNVKMQDFVIGNQTVQVPATLFNSSTTGRNNLASIYNEVVPDKYKEQLNGKLIQKDQFGQLIKDSKGNYLYNTPTYRDLEYYISTYGDPGKLQNALQRISGGQEGFSQMRPERKEDIPQIQNESTLNKGYGWKPSAKSAIQIPEKKRTFELTPTGGLKLD